MVNDTNILKPPVLGPSSSTSPFNLSELKQIIAEIVRNENQQMLNEFSSVNVNDSNETDQTIDAQHSHNLNEMDKIPDVVKSLREFSGQPGEFGSWRKSVDRILKLYESLIGTPKYYGILSVIRNKITGQADTVLESYNTPLNWKKIVRCLTLHYADKRDLGTLEYQMTTLIQRSQTIPEFYQQVYSHLSLILNKLSSMEMSSEAMNAMTKSYREKALDTFIRGLKGDLPRLLSMRGPVDLPEALHLCLKLENVNYRVQHSHGNVKPSQAPPLPPKRTPFHAQGNYTRPNTFYPHLLHNPRPPQTPFRHQNNPRPFFQQPFQRNYPKPEPMDVDESIRSRQVNYMNRPHQQPAYKRPGSNQFHQRAKQQRVNHVMYNAEKMDQPQYQEDSRNEDDQHGQTFLEYTSSQEVVEPEVYAESFSDPYPEDSCELLEEVHFLD